MKKFKLLVATMLVAVMAFAFAACGGSPVVSTWKVTSATFGGVSVDIEEVMGEGNSSTMEIKKDGTVVMISVMEGQTMTEEGTWEFEDDVLTITAEGSSSTLSYEDGKLVMTQSMGDAELKMFLEKQ